MKSFPLFLFAVVSCFLVTETSSSQEASEIRKAFERFANAHNEGTAKEQVSFLSARYKARLAYFHMVEVEFATMGQGVNKELGRKLGPSLNQHLDNLDIERTGSVLKMGAELNEALMSWKDLDKFSLEQIASTAHLPRPIYLSELSDLKTDGATATANYRLMTHPGILGLVLDYRDIDEVGLPGLKANPVKAAVYFEKVEGKWQVSLPKPDGK